MKNIARPLVRELPVLALALCLALLTLVPHVQAASRTGGFSAAGPWTITASAGTGGSITPAGSVMVDDGATQSFAITPYDGYHTAGVTVDGVSQGSVAGYTFYAVNADHAIEASFSANTHTWYLAEGSTDWGFDCYISIVNPNDGAINVKLTYMTTGGLMSGPIIPMPAASQATVFPSASLGSTDFSTRVECLERKTIGVDRTMWWTGTGAVCPEAHCATGVTAPANTWYLPEGSSKWGFECFLLIQNPNAAAANCRVTWMMDGEAPATTTVTVAANSRLTIDMASCIGARDSSIKVTADRPVIPERAMYRNGRREGHDSGGTPTAANDYYLAEGCAGFGFTTYVLIQNPQSTENRVDITYQAASGKVAGPVIQMPPNSRITVCVNDTTPIPGSDPSFSTRVHGSSPLIAERAMYWNGGSDGAQVCHDSIGLSEPSATWYLADGQTTEGRETWTLVQNPNDTAVDVEITYMTPDGSGNVTRTETVPASSRRSFNMIEHSGIGGRAAIMVVSRTSGRKIMVERAMYWNSRGTGTDTIGGCSDTGSSGHTY